MQGALIRKLVAGHLSHLSRYSHAVAVEFDLDIIHQLRTEVKKLRALLRLYSFAHPDDEARISRGMKDLYTAAGIIRDAQMQLVHAILARSEALTGYALWLTNFIAGGQQEWKKKYDERILHKLKHRMERLEWQPLQEAHLMGFFREKMNILNHIALKAHPDDEDLHDIRKQVKDLQHIARVCSQHWPAGFDAISILPLASLDTLAQQAGEYNDERNALDNLQQYICTLQHPSRELIQVQQEWMQVKQENQTALLQGIHEFREQTMPVLAQ